MGRAETDALPLMLGIDAGGSGTKWHLRRGEDTAAQGRLAPLTALLLGQPEGQQVLEELRAALPGPPQAIHLGLPGISAGSVQAQEKRAQVAALFSLPAQRVTLESDLDLAFHAHLQPGEGGLLYAGTGSIAYAVGQDGRVYRAGGRGYRIGDDGGGASIGRAALRWVTDALDRGQTVHGPLAGALAEVTGGLDWDTLRAFVYGGPGASALARLALPVSRAADAGDPDALRITREAAQALAELAMRLRQQIELHTGQPEVPIVATGGAMQSSALQRELLRLLPGVRFQFRPHEAEASRLAGRLLGT